MEETPVKELDLLANMLNCHEGDMLRIAEVVYRDERFPIWSGSSKPEQHHYGEGGLARHTMEVVHLCLANNDYFRGLRKGVNREWLFMAALFHDCGKMWDYEPVPVEEQDPSSSPQLYKVWRGSRHKRLIHHISRSALVWSETAKKFKLSEEMTDAVLHAILAHHGQREWGSPVAPATRLAWILHLCDGLSARLDDCERFDRVK